MPRGDRTGPGGMGPMTGRAAGYCAGYDAPGFASAFGGRGMGRGGFGRGGGRFGRRNMYYATGVPGWMRYGPQGPAAANAWGPAPVATPQNEVAALRQQAEFLQQSLEEINKRLEELAAEEK